MLAFIQNNLGNILVGAVVFFIIFFAVRQLVKNKRSISCSCGDCGSCASGGHGGFVEGTPRRPRYYLDRRIPQWLAG